MSNDSSDSDDESQEPKGKKAGIFSDRSPLGKAMNVSSDSLTQDATGCLCSRQRVIEW